MVVEVSVELGENARKAPIETAAIIPIVTSAVTMTEIAFFFFVNS